MEYFTGKVDLYVLDDTNQPLHFAKSVAIKVDVEDEFVVKPWRFLRNGRLQMGLFIQLPDYLAPDKINTYYVLTGVPPLDNIVDDPDEPTVWEH